MAIPIPVTPTVTTLSTIPVITIPIVAVIGINFIQITDGIGVVTVAATISARVFGPAISMSQGAV